MAVTVLNDEDVERLANMGACVRAVEDALRAKSTGRLVAPPRHHVTFPGAGELVFTVGGQTGTADLAGFRVYDTFAGDVGERPQIVAVWNTRTGTLEGLVVGHRMGPLRTGAIGGAAINALARPGASLVAILGSGAQARAQLAAAVAVRPVRDVRVFSRDPGRRSAFVMDAAKRFGIAARATANAREAVDGADIVLCATTSPTPVLAADWLIPGAHVSTVGPKLKDRHELGIDVAERAALIATDSPAQVDAYPSYFLDGTRHRSRMIDLSDVVSGTRAGRPDDDAVTLFCSAGLAGTEVVVAHALLERARAER